MQTRSPSRLATFKKSFSLIARQKISAALKGKKRGKYKKALRNTLVVGAIGAGALGAGALGAKLVMPRPSQNSGTPEIISAPQKKTRPDLRASEYVGKKVGEAGIVTVKVVGENALSFTGGVAKGSAKAANEQIIKPALKEGWERDKTAKRQVKRIIRVAKTKSKAIKPQIVKGWQQHNASLKKIQEPIKAKVDAGWERHQKANAYLVEKRKKYLGFSGTPRLITFAKAKRRGKPLSAQHKQKISAALKGRKRKSVTKAEQVRAGSLAFNRITGGLAKGADAIKTIGGVYRSIRDSDTRRLLAKSTITASGVGNVVKAGSLLVGVGGLVNRRLADRNSFQIGNRKASISETLGLGRLKLDQQRASQLFDLGNRKATISESLGLGRLGLDRKRASQLFDLGSRKASIAETLGLGRLKLDRAKMNKLNKLRKQIVANGVIGTMAGINLKTP
jgi:hypothetical protein